MLLYKKYIINGVFVTVILVLTTLLYSNHFNNPFEFDDSHSIVTNDAIHEVDVVKFFTDASCLTSHPGNQSYRPVTVLLNALDYQFSKKYNTNPDFKNKPGYNPFYYHLTSFFWYLVLIVLLYFTFFKIFQFSIPEELIHWFSFFATCLFSFHTANAETINYIGGRTDSFSTLCIVASLLLFIYPKTRRFKLYYLTVFLGVLSKQTGLMIIPILFFYMIFFELDLSIKDLFSRTIFKYRKIIFKNLGLITLISTSLFIFTHFYLTPESANPTNQSVGKITYISTQCYVVLFYLGNFILPINLSVDHGMELITPIYDTRILFGFLAILILTFVSYKTSLNKKHRAISFGILWFFFALAPTSLVPLFQVSNDHRLFFAFIGLVLSLSSYLANFYINHKDNPAYKIGLILLLIIVLSGFSYGTRQRNVVWQSSENLWLDAANKNPTNGRALMNYGLSQMEKGNYDVALDYYQRALLEWPNYSSLYINTAIIYGVKNQNDKASAYFEMAINKNPNDESGYYFYARFLRKKDKNKAKQLLEKAVKLSPNYSSAKRLLAIINSGENEDLEKVLRLYDKVNVNTNLSDLIELSQILYQFEKYKECIDICHRILKLDSESFVAYNNLCVSHNQMGDFVNGIKFGEMAIKINPDSELAKNNLNWSISIQKKIKNDQ